MKLKILISQINYIFLVKQAVNPDAEDNSRRTPLTILLFKKTTEKHRFLSINDKVDLI